MTLWHPFTPLLGCKEPEHVVSGRGAKVTLSDGRELIDAVSSWWTSIHGHCHPKIVEAIQAQVAQLDHVMFAGYTHGPAEELGNLLTGMLPGDLDRVFYSDSGSTSVEVALKMATQYFQNRGEARTRFVCFKGAYHGDTVGVMSVGRSGFTVPFEHLLFDVDHLQFDLDQVEDSLKKGDVAAVIVEPLIQGVAGMQMGHTAEFLRALRGLTSRYGALLIFDEVMTGFGRTGELFACLKADVCPDLICLAKGLTGGALPLAATVASMPLYEAFVSDKTERTFLHGHSFYGNPIACAAAVVSTNMLIENPSLYQTMEERHRPHFEVLKVHPNAVNPRLMGDVMALEVRVEGAPEYGHPISHIMREYCEEHGVMVRPLGPSLYLIPPYCITDEELKKCYAVLENCLSHLGSPDIPATHASFK